jgi:hypothetical protein
VKAPKAAQGARRAWRKQMAKSKESSVSSVTEKPEEKSPSEPAGAGDAGRAQPQAQQPGGVKVDDSKLIAMYANFCRVTGTPEELIIDFGLNPQPFGVPSEPVVVNQRIVTNFFTAKRMLHALQLTVQRHEQAFGVLETDVQKRVVPSMRAGR